MLETARRIFAGTASTFARAGFREVARRAPARPIMRHDLKAVPEVLPPSPTRPRRIRGRGDQTRPRLRQVRPGFLLTRRQGSQPSRPAGNPSNGPLDKHTD